MSSDWLTRTLAEIRQIIPTILQNRGLSDDDHAKLTAELGGMIDTKLQPLNDKVAPIAQLVQDDADIQTVLNTLLDQIKTGNTDAAIGTVTAIQTGLTVGTDAGTVTGNAGAVGTDPATGGSTVAGGGTLDSLQGSGNDPVDPNPTLQGGNSDDETVS